MDSVIAKYKGKRDGDLFICPCGVAYADTTKVMKYKKDYYWNYVLRRNNPICKKLNEARLELVDKYVYVDTVLDYGCGALDFIKLRNEVKKHACTYGYDISRKGISRLNRVGLFSNSFEDFDAVCFWDSLEHIPNPGAVLDRCNQNVFISLPILKDFTNIWDFKHYKPGEHLYYFTEKGIRKYLNDKGFKVLEVSDMETKVGRESILTIAAKRKNNYDN